jgi:hypothetical protein
MTPSFLLVEWGSNLHSTHLLATNGNPPSICLLRHETPCPETLTFIKAPGKLDDLYFLKRESKKRLWASWLHCLESTISSRPASLLFYQPRKAPLDLIKVFIYKGQKHYVVFPVI